MVKKARSAKQKANDARLRKMAKAGTLFGRRKSGKRKFVRKKRTTARQPRKSVVRPRTTRRSRGGSVSDINKTLLLQDIGRMSISKQNKMRIVRNIAKRLNI